MCASAHAGVIIAVLVCVILMVVAVIGIVVVSGTAADVVQGTATMIGIVVSFKRSTFQN